MRDWVFLLGGALGLILSFLVAVALANLWVGMLVAGLVATMYLILLDRMLINRIEKNGAKNVIRVLCLLLFTTYGLTVYVKYEQSTYQRESLAGVRSTIDDGIMATEIRRDLVRVFREYQTGSSETIEDAAREVLSDRFLKRNYLEPRETAILKDYRFRYYLDNEDALVLVAYSLAQKGKDETYTNSSTDKGYVEYRGTVTKYGVRYEQTN